MATTLANSESVKFNPSALLSLFCLDASFIGGPILYFFDGTNNNFLPLVFNSITYTPFPVQITGMEYDGKGSLPRPKISLSNVNGIISGYLRSIGDITSARFIRRRVWARFIDAINFDSGVNPYGTPDPTAAYPDEVFYVNRKSVENQQLVEFELVTALEIDNAKLPNRQILANICPFRYRDPLTCGYTAAPISDLSNVPFGAGGYGFTLIDQGAWNNATTYNQGDYVYVISALPQTLGDKIYFVCDTNGTVGDNTNPTFNQSFWVADSCAKKIKSCKLRFPVPQVLRFGGFPGVTRAPLLKG